MIRTIHLHGALAEEFGQRFRLDVASCAEAIRALCVMLPRFKTALETGQYRLFRGAPEARRDTGVDELTFELSGRVDEIHIFPVAVGAKDENIGKVILGTIMIAASFVIPGSAAIFGQSIGALVGQTGMAMVLGGIAGVLAPAPPGPEDQERSDLFSGSVNRATPGAGIPVIFGEYEAAVKIISSAVHLEDRGAAAGGDA